MARTHQRARCSHTGPPCKGCINDILFQRSVRLARAKDPKAHMGGGSSCKDCTQEAEDIINLQTEAAVFGNAGRDSKFDRVAMGVLGELADTTARKYKLALKRGEDKDKARAIALGEAQRIGPLLRRRQEKDMEAELTPSSSARAARREALAELRDATDTVKFVCGPQALEASAELRGVLDKVRGSKHCKDIADHIAQAITQVLKPGTPCELLVELRKSRLSWNVRDKEAQSLCSGDSVWG